jgi:lipooligosaccharide transport system permease protein
MTQGVRAYEYWLIVYRRIWRGTIASSVLNPVLYLTALGVGLGTIVDKGSLGVPYVDYVAPGMLAAVAMQVSAIESAFPVRGAVEWNKQYFSMLATPLRVRDLVSGHLMYIATRAAMVTAVYLAVITAFGAVHSPWALFAIPVGILCGLAYAGPISAISVHAERDPFNPLFRFGIMPMFLFSGTFFPVTQLPDVLRYVAYAIPLWHAVDLTRHLTLGTATLPNAVGHVAYLLAWIVAGVWLTNLAHRKRLIT